MPAVKNVKHLTMRNEKLSTRFGIIDIDEAGNATNLDELDTTADAVLSNVPGFIDADIFGEIKDTAAKPVVLLRGSANQPGNIPLGNGQSILQTDLVRMAYKESGMSEEDWNKLSEVEREDLIGQQVTKLREDKDPEPMVDVSPQPNPGHKLARGQRVVTPDDDEAARAERAAGYATNQVQGEHERADLPFEHSLAAGVQPGQSLINKDEFVNPPPADHDDNSDPHYTGFMETGTQVRQDLGQPGVEQVQGAPGNHVQGEHDTPEEPMTHSLAKDVPPGHPLIQKDEFLSGPGPAQESYDSHETGFIETGTQIRKDEPRDPPPQPGDPTYNDTGKNEGAIDSQKAGSNDQVMDQDAPNEEADDPESKATKAADAKSETKDASDEDVKKLIDANREGNTNSEGYIEIETLNKALRENGFKPITGKRRKEIEDASKK
jgi:hypothetical protein